MHQSAFEEGEEHVAAAVEHGSDLEKEQPELPERESSCRGARGCAQQRGGGRLSSRGGQQPHRHGCLSRPLRPEAHPQHSRQSSSCERGDFVPLIQRNGSHGDSDRQQAPILDRRPSEPPQRHGDDRQDHGLDPVEERRHRGDGAEAHVAPGQQSRDQHRRKYETGAGHDQAAPAATGVAHVDGHLGGIGSGDEVGGAEQIEEVFPAQPPPPPHHFVLQHGDVGSRSAEADDPQFEKDPGYLSEASALSFIALERSGGIHAAGSLSGCGGRPETRPRRG